MFIIFLIFVNKMCLSYIMYLMDSELFKFFKLIICYKDEYNYNILEFDRMNKDCIFLFFENVN